VIGNVSLEPVIPALYVPARTLITSPVVTLIIAQVIVCQGLSMAPVPETFPSVEAAST
jgi:hypothetical protein